MWTRKELKARGKAAFKANYWRCVLAALIIVLISGGLSAASGFRTSQNAQQVQQQAVVAEINGQSYSIGSQEDFDAFLQDPAASEALAVIMPVILGVIGAIAAVGILLSILVFNPLMVGCTRFFTRNSKAPAELGEMGFGFRGGNYGRSVLTMLITGVFLLLWTLLFIIPGIVKAYSYRMVPYILAEEPELSGRAAITRSREMMNGNKWRTFVLDLSFILWILLSAVTLGIVGIFYVNPYICATDAELYYALRGDHDAGSHDPGGFVLNGEAL